jgi:general stress protein CsbA
VNLHRYFIIISIKQLRIILKIIKFGPLDIWRIVIQFFISLNLQTMFGEFLCPNDTIFQFPLSCLCHSTNWFSYFPCSLVAVFATTNISSHMEIYLMALLVVRSSFKFTCKRTSYSIILMAFISFNMTLVYLDNFLLSSDTLMVSHTLNTFFIPSFTSMTLMTV